MSPSFQFELVRSGSGTPDPWGPLTPGMRWRKSSRSSGGACVEVGHSETVIAVRDTTDRGGPVLAFPAGTWAAFTTRVKAS